MRFVGLRAWSLGAALLAAGCGASVAIEPGEEGETEAPSGPDVEPSTTVTPTCDFDGAKGSVLVVVQDRAVVFVRGDGSRQAVLELPELPAGASYFEVKSRGGMVGVTAVGYEPDGTMHGAAALIAADGTVVFADTALAGGASMPFVSEKGDMVFAVGWHESRLVRRDGTSESFDQTTPLGAPDATGLFPVTRTESVYAMVYGLASPKSGVVSVGLDSTANGALGFDGGLTYLGMVDGVTPVLVRETAAGPESLDAPGVDPTMGLYLKSGSPRGDALVMSWTALPNGDYVPNDFLLVAGAAQPIEIGAPEGRYPFGQAYYAGSLLDDAGRPAIVARNAHTGGVFVRDGGAWRGVGPTFANVWDVAVTTRGGTVVGQASDQPGYFEMRPWEPTPAGQPPAERRGPSGFVTRVDGGDVLDFPVDATVVTLSADGGCIAYAREGSVSTLELDGDELTALGSFGDPATTTPAMAWLE
jgi:hypothetical protein